MSINDTTITFRTSVNELEPLTTSNPNVKAIIANIAPTIENEMQLAVNTKEEADAIRKYTELMLSEIDKKDIVSEKETATELAKENIEKGLDSDGAVKDLIKDKDFTFLKETTNKLTRCGISGEQISDMIAEIIDNLDINADNLKNNFEYIQVQVKYKTEEYLKKKNVIQHLIW